MKTLVGFRYWITVIIVVVIGIVFVAHKQHNAAEKYKRHRAEYCSALGSTPQQKKECIEKRTSARDYLAWGYDLVGWPEGITTWAILLTLGAIIWQSSETRKAARAAEHSADASLSQIKVMKDSVRARLVIRTLDVPEVSGPQPIMDGLRSLEVRAFVENVGKSKAFNVHASGMVDITQGPIGIAHDPGFEQYFPMIIDDDGKRHPLKLAGFGEAAEGFSTGDFVAISDDILHQVRDGKSFVQVSGLLRYEDIFDDPHETPFKFIWHSRGDDAGERWLTRSVWFNSSPPST